MKPIRSTYAEFKDKQEAMQPLDDDRASTLAARVWLAIVIVCACAVAWYAIARVSH